MTKVLERITFAFLYSTVLEEIEQHPAAKEFIEPVDRERADNYYDIITEPMCLANMAIKVFEGVYKTPKMVKKNVVKFINVLLEFIIVIGDSCAVL